MEKILQLVYMCQRTAVGHLPGGTVGHGLKDALLHPYMHAVEAVVFQGPDIWIFSMIGIAGEEPEVFQPADLQRNGVGLLAGDLAERQAGIIDKSLPYPLYCKDAFLHVAIIIGH